MTTSSLASATFTRMIVFLTSLVVVGVVCGSFVTFLTTGDSLRIVTGSYNGMFYVCDAFGSQISQMNASTPSSPRHGNNTLDSSQKVLHTAWHPNNDVIGVGSKDFGFLYLKQQTSESEEVWSHLLHVLTLYRNYKYLKVTNRSKALNYYYCCTQLDIKIAL